MTSTGMIPAPGWPTDPAPGRSALPGHPAKACRRATPMAGGGRLLQPPWAASIRNGSAAQPPGWVQGRSALPDVLLANTVVGPYCVSRGTEIAG